MKPKMFLLLSGILGAVEGRKYDNGDNVDNFNTYGRSQSLVRKTFKSDAMKKCQGNNEIARWINDQVIQTDKLTRFNEHLGNLIDAFNASVPIKDCCFYEKNIMGNIIKNINKLAEENGTARIQPFGELGKDLNQILEMMKKLIYKDITSCCQQLYESLKKLENKFFKQIGEIKKNAEQITESQHKHRESLKMKQTELEGKIKGLPERLSKLEKRINGTGKTDPKCCTESEKIFNNLNDKVLTTKREHTEKANKLQRQIDDLTDQQNVQNKSINEVRSIVESRTETIKSFLTKCEQNFNTGSFRLEPQCDLSDLEKRIKQSEDNIGRLFNRLPNLVSSNKDDYTSDTILLRQQIKDDVALIEKLMEKLTNGGKSVDTSENGNNATQRFINVEDLEKSKVCCHNIDKLGDNAKELQNNFRNMNASSSEHVRRSQTSLKDLQKRLNEALDKMNKLKEDNEASATKSQSDYDSIYQSVNVLQNQLNGAEVELDQIRNRMNETQTLIGLVVENCNEKFFELNNSLIAKILANDELNKKVKRRLDKIEEKLRRKKETNLDNIVKRLEHFEELYKTLGKDVTKVLLLENRVDYFEKLIKDALENYKNMETGVTECLVKCKNMNKVDDLIDRIEDLEEAVKKCKRPTQLTETTKQSMLLAPRETENIKPSVIGGSDFMKDKYGEDWLKNT